MCELGFCYPYDSNIFWDGRNTELNNHWLTIETFSYEEIKDGLELQLYETYDPSLPPLTGTIQS